jgi:hypothetical protein
MVHACRVNSELADEPPATEAETRGYLLSRSKRDFVPISKAFVQRPPGTGDTRPGPLAEFVRGRDLRGLQALLFIIACTSSGSGPYGWSTTLPIQVWARAFGTTRNATPASAATAASKVLSRLEKRRLVERSKHGRSREVRVTVLREDGSGEQYTRPLGDVRRFLKLPHDYWTADWHEQLDLPATAMLLVALHEKPWFELPTQRMPEWYGWSADTAERGFRTLRDRGLLEVRSYLRKTPLSPTGQTAVNLYHLLPPFAEPMLPVAPTIKDFFSQGRDVSVS